MPFDLATYDRFRTSRVIGGDVYYRDETTSTMDDARAGAAAGGDCGTAYVAGAQTGGRGRLGREWASPGNGLYVTFHLCARDAATVPLYTVAAALAVADAVRETSHLVADIKWPNDVLYDGRKLAGVLAESVFGGDAASRGGRIDVFLGMGINLRSSGLPPELEAVATSIAGAGAEPPATEELLAALSAALERHVTQLERSPAVVVEEWRARLVTLGRRVRLTSVDGLSFEGEAVDVSPRGELVLRLDDGAVMPFSAGDVTTA